MKKLFFLAIFACFSYFGTIAQTSPGNSAYGHSHKKAKKAKKHYHANHRINADRKAINVTHKSTIRSIKDNDALTNQQQKVLVKQANTTHKVQMKNETISHKAGKKNK